jgi:2-hydroxy-3-keto-5-methylthiopentenyl-1-phosphate phosphatase
MSKSNKYIVLDIDATLVHTHDEDSTKFEILDIYSDEDKIKYRKNLYVLKIIDVSRVSGSGEVSVLSGIFRPHLRAFLDYCRKYFAGIVIWSAGQKKYVEKLVENMFPFEDFQPILVYSYHDCIEINNDVDFIKKPLAKLYKDKRLKGKLNEKNTLILDDRDDTFSLNSKNGVKIPEFESDMSIEDISGHDDINLLKFMSWLETKEVKNCEDVRKLRKDKIFKKSLEDYNKQLKSEKKK